MTAGLGRWRGLVLDHLVHRLGPDADDLPLNVHTVWALLLARRGLLDDDPAVSRALATRVRVLLDSDAITGDTRQEVEATRSALQLAGVRT